MNGRCAPDCGRRRNATVAPTASFLITVPTRVNRTCPNSPALQMRLAGQIHLHFRRHVFDSLAGYIHQSLLHRPGKGERRLVVRHDRRAGVRADEDVGRQAERQRYRHGQIALTHWRAIDELDERQPHPQAVRTFAPSNRRTFFAGKAHWTDARPACDRLCHCASG
jgi:hypothetical protein